MNIDFHELKRVVVSIDPAATHGEGADDTGIVVVARGPHQDDSCKLMDLVGRCPGHGYVLGDFTCHLSPPGWAKRAITVYDRFQADRIIAEVNNGGDMVGTTIHAVRAGVPYKAVNASRGKKIRAQPVAALWEQGRMHFVNACPELEDEMTTWTDDSKWSPNRMDALVWGCTALGLIGGQGTAFMQVWRGETAQRRESAKNNGERLTAQTRRQSLEQRELARVLRLFPKRGEQHIIQKTVGCTDLHRWRGNVCLLCGMTTEQTSEQGVTRG